jgi:hypothetical protein
VFRYHHAGDKGERNYSSYSFLILALDGVSGQRHAPAALYPRGKRPPRYPLDRRLGILCKGKAAPQHTYGGTGGEDAQLLLIQDLGSRRGERSASRPGRALAPGKGPPVPIVQEAGFAPGPIWKQIRRKASCLCRVSNLDCPVLQSIARHYTD